MFADPGVLEDVQRALRLKARREARLRTQSSPLRVESYGPSDITSLSSAGSSQGGHTSTQPPFPRPLRISGDSEIDFSPSVGVPAVHAVPSSLDDGITLDWSIPPLEDVRERRWSLSRGKRKSREQVSLMSDKASFEKEEALHASKVLC